LKRDRIDGGRESTVVENRRWSRIDGNNSFDDNNRYNCSSSDSSCEIQEIWDSNSLLLNPWWNMLDNVLDKTPNI